MRDQKIKISLNHSVWVKLTQEGRSHLHHKGIIPPDSDSEGYSEWLLWFLIESFGDAISINKPNCFEDGIFVDPDELGI